MSRIRLVLESNASLFDLVFCFFFWRWVLGLYHPILKDFLSMCNEHFMMALQ